jgi:hypothetical protein
MKRLTRELSSDFEAFATLTESSHAKATSARVKTIGRYAREDVEWVKYPVSRPDNSDPNDRPRNRAVLEAEAANSTGGRSCQICMGGLTKR